MSIRGSSVGARLLVDAGDLFDGCNGRELGRAGLGFGSGHEKAPEAAHVAQVDQPHVGGLLGLVGRERGVRGRVHLENVERLAAHDHVAVPHPVDELALLAVDPGDDLRRHDPRLDPRVARDAHAAQDRVHRRLDLPFVVIVQLEHPVRALDDLHPGPAGRGLERDVGELVDRDPRRDLEEHRRFVLERHKARAHRLQEAGELRLQRIEHGERT